MKTFLVDVKEIHSFQVEQQAASSVEALKAVSDNIASGRLPESIQLEYRETLAPSKWDIAVKVA